MTKDLTQGKPFPLILEFSIPVLLGYLFQQFYNLTDTVIVGKSPVDGVWRIYVDSSDYYNPVPDDFQVYIGSVQHSADHPYIALAFGRELYTDTGRPAVRYRLDYHADTDQFTYEEE